MVRLRLLFSIVSIFILMSCQLIVPPPIDKFTIIGQWVEKDITLEICEDGRIISTDVLTGEELTGSFELIDNNIMRITYEPTGPLDYKVSVYQGKLTLACVNNNATARLTRCNNSSLCLGQSYCNHIRRHK